jgi:hypothetical protein
MPRIWLIRSASLVLSQRDAKVPSALAIAAQNGFAPIAGILSALLASRRELLAPEALFSRRHGFFRVIEPDHDMESLPRDLGSRHVGIDPGDKSIPMRFVQSHVY